MRSLRLHYNTQLSMTSAPVTINNSRQTKQIYEYTIYKNNITMNEHITYTYIRSQIYKYNTENV